MFGKLFNWFGKSDEEYMKEPRRVPDSARDIPDGDDRWIMTREFAWKDKVNRRHYFAARSSDAKSWTIVEISYDLKDGEIDHVEREVGTVKTPRDAIDRLVVFESNLLSSGKDFVPVPGSYPTYLKFANRNGLHFDNNGFVFRVLPDEPLMKDVILPRESLDRLFNPESRKIPAISTWEGIYARLVDVLPENAAPVADLRDDGAYADYRKSAQEMMKKLEQLSQNLQSDKYAMHEKERALRNMAGYVIVNPLGFASSAKATTAQHLCDATIVIGLLRAGSDIYQAQFAENKTISTEMLHLVRRIGETVSTIAAQRFSIPPGEAKKITDIIGQGPDPFGPALPLEAVFVTLEKRDSTPPLAPDGKSRNTPFF